MRNYDESKISRKADLSKNHHGHSEKVSADVTLL